MRKVFQTKGEKINKKTMTAFSIKVIFLSSNLINNKE